MTITGMWEYGQKREWHADPEWIETYLDSPETLVATDEVMGAADLVRVLYDWPGCIVGGPLHVTVDDMNVDILTPWYSDEFPRTEPLGGLCDLICEALGRLTEDQRCLAIGYADPPRRQHLERRRVSAIDNCLVHTDTWWTTHYIPWENVISASIKRCPSIGVYDESKFLWDVLVHVVGTPEPVAIEREVSRSVADALIEQVLRPEPRSTP